MKSAGELRQDGGGMLLARSREQCDVRLITNSGRDHGKLFGRLSRTVDRLRITASGSPVVIKVGEMLDRGLAASRFRHDQRQGECTGLDAGNIHRGKSEAGAAYGVQDLAAKRIADSPYQIRRRQL